MESYKCLDSAKYEIGDYSLISLREEDIYKIKVWRNSQMDVLRQNKVLTDTDQENYYKNAILPTFSQSNPKQILFSLLYLNQCIGYGGLTNIDWESKRAEMSFLVDVNRVNNKDIYIKDFTTYIALIKKVAFKELKFNRLFTETFDIRPLHISILESCGFVFEGKMKQHVFINDKFVDSLIHGILKEDYRDA
ncbi:MAG: GNAT family N-acetyltransferase [Bacteroidia bacterium]|nr:GNAT family N-acetyltransferase [Bacteroidia bacterium]